MTEPLAGQVVYLVRHCQAEGQAPDARLTAEGCRQAEALAELLAAAGVDRVVSSPFVRARDSIAPLAGRLGLPIELDRRLCERVLSPGPLSDWHDRLRASFDDLDLCLPGGESSRAATARAAAVLDEIRGHCAPTTILVTHGNLLALLLRHLDGCFGFDEWARLTQPDIFRLELDQPAQGPERVWR